MPKYYGVSLYEGTIHEDGSGLLDAVDAWVAEAGGTPRWVPIWNPLSKAGTAPAGGIFPGTAIFDGLEARGIRPMIYMTTRTKTDTEAARGYQSYIDGDHDDQLTTWAEAAAAQDVGIIVRLDQEMGAKWAPWGQKPPWQYKQAFRHIRKVIQATAPKVEFFYCPERNANTIRNYYPGHAADIVGFDAYSRREEQDSLPGQWAMCIRELQKLSSARIIVGEFGRFAHLKRRLAWLQTLADVKGVFGALYFDMDTEPDVEGSETDTGDDWEMTAAMREYYGSLL